MILTEEIVRVFMLMNSEYFFELLKPIVEKVLSQDLCFGDSLNSMQMKTKCSSGQTPLYRPTILVLF